MSPSGSSYVPPRFEPSCGPTLSQFATFGLTGVSTAASSPGPKISESAAPPSASAPEAAT